MSNTEQAQEPTMEEILASIRRIISDDGDDTADNDSDAEASAAENEPEEAQVDAEADSEDGLANQIDFDSIDIGEDDDDVLELTEVVEEDPETEEPADEENAADDIAFIDAETAEEPEQPDFADEPLPAADGILDDSKRIMSENTDSAVATAFGQLASTMLSREGQTRTLEELVQEMLRPMLKSWLDENLPRIVEDLVRQEIERAARRGGR